MITRATEVVRRGSVLANDLSNNETVMLDIDQGLYFGVKDVARVIWSRLAEPVSVDELCDGLQLEFDVDAATCEREVVGFLEQLATHGLIDVDGDATTG